jgi:inositol phosphorylceramide mannosyltransferase catalytic subunit
MRLRVFLILVLSLLIWMGITYKVTRISHQFQKEDDLIQSVVTLGIPRIFHQMSKDSNHSQQVVSWRNRCEMLNPDWKFILWTDETIQELVTRFFPSFHEMFKNYDHKMKRVDASRYMILYRYGGVYIDLDMTCLRPIPSDLFRYPDTFYTARQVTENQPNYSQRCANAFMASEPKNPFLKKLLDNLPSRTDLHVVDATGPAFLTSIIDSEKNSTLKVHEFLKEEIFSVDYVQRQEIDKCKSNLTLCEELYPGIFFSFWDGSWLPKASH